MPPRPGKSSCWVLTQQHNGHFTTRSNCSEWGQELCGRQKTKDDLNLAIMIRKESKQQYYVLPFLPGPPPLTFQAAVKYVFYCQLINDGSLLLAEIVFCPACAYMLSCFYDISQARVLINHSAFQPLEPEKLVSLARYNIFNMNNIGSVRKEKKGI